MSHQDAPAQEQLVCLTCDRLSSEGVKLSETFAEFAKAAARNFNQ